MVCCCKPVLIISDFVPFHDDLNACFADSFLGRYEFGVYFYSENFKKIVLGTYEDLYSFSTSDIEKMRNEANASCVTLVGDWISAHVDIISPSRSSQIVFREGRKYRVDFFFKEHDPYFFHNEYSDGVSSANVFIDEFYTFTLLDDSEKKCCEGNN